MNKLTILLLPFHEYHEFLSVSKSKEDFYELINNTELIIGGKNLNSKQIKKRIKISFANLRRYIYISTCIKTV